MATTTKRIYCVTKDGVQRLVRATHPNPALMHVARVTYSVRVATQAEFTPRNVQTREDRDRLVYQVEVAIPNPEGLLRPGMPVEIRIPGTGKGSR